MRENKARFILNYMLLPWLGVIKVTKIIKLKRGINAKIISLLEFNLFP